jgi:hypothetical protein
MLRPMNLLFLSILASMTTHAAHSATQNMQQALNDAKIVLDAFARNSSQKERDAVVEYLPYYKSWAGYQSVTPAPYALTETINSSPAAKTFIADLTTIAKQFVQEQADIDIAFVRAFGNDLKGIATQFEQANKGADSLAARALIDNLKNKINAFEQQQSMAGKSKISPNGFKFYDKVVDMAKNKLSAQTAK